MKFPNRVRWKPLSLDTTKEPSNRAWGESKPSLSGKNTPPASLADTPEGSRTLGEAEARETKEHTQSAKMTASVAEDVFTPPHLRKANIAKKQATDAQQAAGNASPTITDKPKLAQAGKLQSSKWVPTCASVAHSGPWSDPG